MAENFGTVLRSVNVVGSELLLGPYTHKFGKHSKGHMQCFR